MGKDRKLKLLTGFYKQAAEAMAVFFNFRNFFLYLDIRFTQTNHPGEKTIFATEVFSQRENHKKSVFSRADSLHLFSFCRQ